MGLTCSYPDGPPDFDGDGTVGILDMMALQANWGKCAWNAAVEVVIASEVTEALRLESQCL